MDSICFQIADAIAVLGQKVLMQKLFGDYLPVQGETACCKLNIHISGQVDSDITSCVILDSDICIDSNRILSRYSSGNDKFNFSISGLGSDMIKIGVPRLVDYSCFLNKILVPFIDFLLNTENKLLLQGDLVNNSIIFPGVPRKSVDIQKFLIVSEGNVYESFSCNDNSAIYFFKDMKVHDRATNIAESLFWLTERQYLYFRGLLYSYMFLFPDKPLSEFKENYLRAVKTNLEI